MPSFIAHTAAGYAIARVSRKSTQPPSRSSITAKYGWALLAVALANMPDIDFVPQLVTGERFHHGPTHSLVFLLGSAVLIWVGAWVWARASQLRVAATYALVVASHTVLDYFSTGGDGVQLFWPWSTETLKSPAAFFPPVHYSRGLIDSSHLEFIVFELAFSAVLIGLVFAAERLRSTRHRASQAADSQRESAIVHDRACSP